MASYFAALLLMLSLAASAASDEASSAVPPPLAPGYSALPYQPPPPGSYRLPIIGEAADGEVLDERGQRVRLHDLFGDKFVLLSFMYSRCSDANGCPLTSWVFSRLNSAMSSMIVAASTIHCSTRSSSTEPQQHREKGLAGISRQPNRRQHFRIGGRCLYRSHR